MRWRQLQATEIAFIHNPEFDSIELDQLSEPDRKPDGPLRAVTRSQAVDPARTAATYLARLGDVDLLSAEEELGLFRRMNYLKYQAALARQRFDPEQPDTRLLDRAEQCLAEAVTARNRLIAANLRLVVSVARRYVDSANSLSELISDGNMSLMRAVEKFDYGRGFRFSTYATWALRYNFSRSLATQRQRRSKFVGGDEQIAELPDQNDVSPVPTEARYDRLRSALAAILGRLDARERKILQQRFGIGPVGEEHTLQEIANEMGVCKERVRQLQLRALSKLRELAAEVNLTDDDSGLFDPLV